MADPSMIAGSGEETLAEKYNLTLRLPVPEDEFLDTIRRLGLHMEVCGRRDSDVGLPSPFYDTSIDLSRVETCYVIYGDRDSTKAERWRAFADDRRRIIYVEGAYAFPAP